MQWQPPIILRPVWYTIISLAPYSGVSAVVGLPVASESWQVVQDLWSELKYTELNRDIKIKISLHGSIEYIFGQNKFDY